MSLRKRYPLQTLIQLREHRTELARQFLFEKQRETQACRDQCVRIQDEIDVLDRDHAHQRMQLLAPPPPGMLLTTALERREHHINHLSELAAAARGRLRQAQQALQKAEQAQEDARNAYFRARARQEALEKRRELWRKEQRSSEARREEVAAEDLMFGRRIPLIPS